MGMRQLQLLKQGTNIRFLVLYGATSSYSTCTLSEWGRNISSLFSLSFFCIFSPHSVRDTSLSSRKMAGKEKEELLIAAAQISPVWLDKNATLKKVIETIREAGDEGVELLAFGEAAVPGYPYWLETTNGCQWDNDLQKETFAHYAKESVSLVKGDLEEVCRAVKESGVLSVILGVVERNDSIQGCSGHSLFCSAVFIDGEEGKIANVHRKLMPTFDERLVWAPGPGGSGLKTKKVGPFNVSMLNCWENWVIRLSQLDLILKSHLNKHLFSAPFG